MLFEDFALFEDVLLFELLEELLLDELLLDELLLEELDVPDLLTVYPFSSILSLLTLLGEVDTSSFSTLAMLNLLSKKGVKYVSITFGSTWRRMYSVLGKAFSGLEDIH